MGTRLYREEIYQDDSGGWRWRVFAVNGENVGNSSGELRQRVQRASCLAQVPIGDERDVH